MHEISSWRRQYNEVVAERDTLTRLSSKLTRQGQQVQEQVSETSSCCQLAPAQGA